MAALAPAAIGSRRSADQTLLALNIMAKKIERVFGIIALLRTLILWAVIPKREAFRGIVSLAD